MSVIEMCIPTMSSPREYLGSTFDSTPSFWQLVVLRPSMLLLPTLEILPGTKPGGLVNEQRTGAPQRRPMREST